MSFNFAIAPDGSCVGGGIIPLRGIPATIIYSPDGSITVDLPQVIPLAATPAQRLSVGLSGLPCTLVLYSKRLMVPVAQDIPTDPPALQQIDVMFMDCYVNDALVKGGVLCCNKTLIIMNSYLGFPGDMAFVDTQGSDDPVYTGLNTRWFLTWYPNLP